MTAAAPPRRIRHRALALVVLVVALLAAVAVADPFHLLFAPWYAGVLVGLGIVLLTVWAALQARRTTWRIAVAAAGLLVTAVWVVLTWASVVFSPGLATVREVPGPPGSRLRLALVETRTFAADGPAYSVRARAGSGPFLQDSPVWVGLGEGVPPAELRFADDRTVEVVPARGCGYRSTVDPVTLAVDPVHRPLRLDGC
ncbi:hypothetical protein ACL02T_25075 [Pseudonocardia sp. RS010]|uniref:hypothetical protein n=1 Tax=Pseudonocardia sp. RS010 TaxID=3385979 RepID=UPI0039A069E3